VHYLGIGEDPYWALYRKRERLDFTDPPTAAPPQSALRADITAVPAVGAHDGTTATPTSSTLLGWRVVGWSGLGG
jgi:hypothetical protein